MKHRSRYYKQKKSRGITKRYKRQDKFKEFVNKDVQSLETKYAIHGQLNLNFIDTQLTTGSYSWDRVTPSGLTQLKSSRALRSLRHLSAETIASQASKLSPELLATLPWSIWKIVWTMILATNTDSIQVYTLFLKNFGHLPDFKSHKAHIVDVRDETIAFTQIPQNRLHRVESLFSNILISEMIHNLAELKSFVIWDMSQQQSKMPKEEYFLIFNIPNLICVDLSNHDVDDVFLQHLGFCIGNSTKLNQLRMIKLSNTKVTPTGAMKFLDAILFQSCKLSYIQLDFKLDHKHWQLMDSGRMRIVQTMPMGLSLNALTRLETRLGTTLSRSCSPNQLVSKTPILDIFIAKELYNSHNMEEAWNLRNRSLKSNKNRTTFVYERSTFIDMSNIWELYTDEEKPQRQRKAIKTNAREFFSI